MGYYYRRDDNGKLEQVEFGIAIEQDIQGYITMEDGAKAKRVYSKDPKQKKAKRIDPKGHPDQPIFNDNLGFGQHQLEQFETDRKAHGMNDIEFIRDPKVPEYITVKASSRSSMDKYIKHRRMFDKSGVNGGKQPLSPGDFEKAKELLERVSTLR